jgi:hypothetical protein
MTRTSLWLAIVVLLAAGCGRLGDVASGIGRDCHPDPATVDAIRNDPVLTQPPPGARFGAEVETESCGWDSAGPPTLGAFGRAVMAAGDAERVSAFYAELARSGGWQVYPDSVAPGVFDAAKDDGTGCTWHLRVGEAPAHTYFTEVTYTPRDVRPTCL